METPTPLEPVDPNVSRQSPRKQKTIEELSNTSPSQRDKPSRLLGVDSTENFSRPQLLTQASSQRGKKRISWRNKICHIVLPSENESGLATSKKHYLQPAEVETRLREWEERGFDIAGFVLEPSPKDSQDHQSHGQSRPMHPDPNEQALERERQSYRVILPDRQEWDDYVAHLKEEKLRALGVTFSDGEVSSRKSPAPSLMSRQASSQSSALLKSPAMHATSVSSMPLNNSFPVGPAVNSKPGVSHFPRYSVAAPLVDRHAVQSIQGYQGSATINGTVSPLNYLSSQPNSGIASPRSNERTAYSASVPPPRNGTPSSIGATNVTNINDDRHLSQTTSDGVKHAHAMLSEAETEQTTPNFDFKASKLQSGSVDDHAETEIASPMPRSHRQNPSESLQREVEEAEAYLEQLDNAAAKPVTSTHFSGGQESINGSDPARTNQQSIKSPPLVDENDFVGQHASKTSISSSLNVNAPEFKFEPALAITSDVFAFLPHSQPSKLGLASATQPTLLGPHARKASSARPPQKLNAAAPTFTPSTSLKPRIPSRVFSFGENSVPRDDVESTDDGPSRDFVFSSRAASFNPDAPAFTPSEKATDTGSGNAILQPSAKPIFGEYNQVDNLKGAKKSKALPIVKPDRRASLDSDLQEDESGRITQPDARQKRVRRAQEDGDQVPLFVQQPEPYAADPGQTGGMLLDQSLSRDGESPTTSLKAATNLLEEMVGNSSPSDLSSVLSTNESHPRDIVNNDADLHELPSPLRRSSSEDSNTSYQAKPRSAGRHEATESAASSIYSDKPARMSKLSDERVERADGPRGQHMLHAMRDFEPSYHEIDNVMRHLNQDGDSDIGVERRPSPQGNHDANVRRGRSPRQDLQKTVARQLMPPANIRSDAPSPSPNRLKEPFQYLPPTYTDSDDSLAARIVAENARYSPSYRPSKTMDDPPTVHQLNSLGSSPPSDWNDHFSSVDEDVIKSRTTFFDRKVDDIIGATVQQRLGPLEKMLFTIQDSLTEMSRQSTARPSGTRTRSSGTFETAMSDADDEDDAGETDQTRLKSPLRDRKFDQLKKSISELALAHKNNISSAQLQEFTAAVKSFESSLAQKPTSVSEPSDIKAMIEDTIKQNVRGKSAPVVSSTQAAAAEKSQLKIAGLESMLSIAEGRAEDEMKARRATEDALADNQRLLRHALEESAEQREYAEATESKLRDFNEERQAHLRRIAVLEGSQEGVDKTAADLFEKNAALESTLDEYRASHNQWRASNDELKLENRHLEREARSLESELGETKQARNSLQQFVVRLQDQIASISRNVAANQASAHTNTQQHLERLDLLSTRLEAEARTRERLELEIERLETQEGETMKLRSQLDQTHRANERLEKATSHLHNELQDSHSKISYLQRELQNAKENGQAELHKLRASAEFNVSSARNVDSAARAELQATIDSQQRKLEEAASLTLQMKSSHERALEDSAASYRAALLESAENSKMRLREQNEFNEHVVGQLKAQHERDTAFLAEKLEHVEANSQSKLHHAIERSEFLNEKIAHLEEKLEISQAAAHAAAQAASGKSAEAFLVENKLANDRRPDGPEKISPQALRESILVLQEQLQAREATIEELESQISSHDPHATRKLNQSEAEVSWLRELLSVRVDDLRDIIDALASPSFQRENVRDAAIRLKTGLEMEVQEKDKAVGGIRNLTAIANIGNLAASPSALPLAAAAAWGSWRKRRDSRPLQHRKLGDEDHLQTPSRRSVSSSPFSTHSGLLTPPSTNQRVLPQDGLAFGRHRSTPKTKPRAPPDSLSRPEYHEQSMQGPSTPPLLQMGSYDLDAAEASVFDSEQASGDTLQIQDNGTGADEFGPRLGALPE